MKMQPCDICQTADPALVFSQSSPFSSWRKMPGGVEWAQDVYVCKECGSPRRFLDKITLPLLTATCVMIAILYWVDFAWWARWFSYFVALPLLVQFADEAIEHWRVPTGKLGVDW